MNVWDKIGWMEGRLSVKGLTGVFTGFDVVLLHTNNAIACSAGKPLSFNTIAVSELHKIGLLENIQNDHDAFVCERGEQRTLQQLQSMQHTWQDRKSTLSRWSESCALCCYALADTGSHVS